VVLGSGVLANERGEFVGWFIPSLRGKRKSKQRGIFTQNARSKSKVIAEGFLKTEAQRNREIFMKIDGSNGLTSLGT